jgi:hypothetical protein
MMKMSDTIWDIASYNVSQTVLNYINVQKERLIVIHLPKKAPYLSLERLYCEIILNCHCFSTCKHSNKRGKNNNISLKPSFDSSFQSQASIKNCGR